MTVLITLTAAGTDSGPFNLYSDLDGYTIPFERNVNKSALTAGYLTSLVPDYTAIIRAVSQGVCVNYVNIVLENTTTTSTTSTTTTLPPPVPCNATSVPGGAGVTESSIPLNAIGGVIIFQVTGQGIPDKFEIIHNGVKKATSSMAAGNTNSGPFDDIYGNPTPPPDEPSTSAIPQFIGTDKGAVPTRKAEFDAANPGLGYIDVTSGYQQLLWWRYTPADWTVSQNAIIRATGPTGTSWNTQRLCVTTSTTSSTSSTTSTTTTQAPVYQYSMTPAFPTGAGACGATTLPNTVYSTSIGPTVGANIYIDSALTTPVAGGGNFYRLSYQGPIPHILADVTGQINGSGNLYQLYTCT